MILVWWFSFYYVPAPFTPSYINESSSISVLDEDASGLYAYNGYLLVFFLLFCIYFTLSAI